ncbi:nitrogenase [Planctomycetales bacterium ZRK34]|nr:nitrogenase [Planctomycetales bacterium ZRK34]
MITKASNPNFVATRNACKMCTPLGACLAFAGIEKCLPFLHGSQGCSTYIRRYLISHFREPMDIASSNFGEQAAIFGGQANLSQGLSNVIQGYNPKVIGLATTCLSETIGDDVPMFLHEFAAEHPGEALPVMIHASTPSYTGSHADGYVEAIRATVATIAEGGERDVKLVDVLPGIVSPADLRHLREIVKAFGLEPIVLPDYSDRLDGPSWAEYRRIPEGGTPLEDIRRMGTAAAALDLGTAAKDNATAGAVLAKKFGVTRHRIGLPIGVRASDALFEALESISGQPTPEAFVAERGRLVDSYVDAHKYVFGKRAIVYGDEDMVAAMSGFLAEIGVMPVLCASGGKSGTLADAIASAAPGLAEMPEVIEGVDFEDLTEAAESVSADLIVGHSKGYKLARELDLPLVRVGLPIHDRFGAARMLHVGYEGTQQLFDRIVNTLLESKQDLSEMGYTYL